MGGLIAWTDPPAHCSQLRLRPGGGGTLFNSACSALIAISPCCVGYTRVVTVTLVLYDILADGGLVVTLETLTKLT